MEVSAAILQRCPYSLFPCKSVFEYNLKKSRKDFPDRSDEAGSRYQSLVSLQDSLSSTSNQNFNVSALFSVRRLPVSASSTLPHRVLGKACVSLKSNRLFVISLASPSSGSVWAEISPLPGRPAAPHGPCQEAAARVERAPRTKTPQQNRGRCKTSARREGLPFVPGLLLSRPWVLGRHYAQRRKATCAVPPAPGLPPRPVSGHLRNDFCERVGQNGCSPSCNARF